MTYRKAVPLSLALKRALYNSLLITAMVGFASVVSAYFSL